MERLNFTTAVLGQKAASRLRERQVTQTIRSGSSSIVLAISDQRVKSGELIQVTLDDEFVGYAKATSMDKVRLDDLTQDDARRGGFDNRFELFYALRRAGYRFKPLNEYVFYRCQFAWRWLKMTYPGEIKFVNCPVCTCVVKLVVDKDFKWKGTCPSCWKLIIE